MTSWTEDIPNNVPEKPQYIYGLMCWGQNPLVGGPSVSFERKNMANLDWLACVDLWETETAAFWKPKDPLDPNSECLGIPGVMTKDIATEVIFLPAAASYEKEGSITNSGRWSQWRYKALEPPGEAMDDLSILNELGKRLIWKGANSYQSNPTGDPYLDDPLKNLWWGPYCDGGLNEDAWGMDGSSYDEDPSAADPRDPSGAIKITDPHKAAKEINGYWCSNGPAANIGKRVDGFWGNYSSLNTLQENGQTSCGNWLYCSHYANPGDYINPFDSSDTTPTGNRQENRDPTEKARVGNEIGLFQNWTICWPVNRRIIYNGASVYQTGHPSVGEPRAPHKWVLDFGVGGTGGTGPNVDGGDVPDGFTAPGGTNPRYAFIMLPEGHGKLFGPGREDGPFPEHYEPMETVLSANTISDVVRSPTLFAHARPEAYEVADPGDPDFPIIGTTYRLTEHWQAGQMTRNNPWLCQLMPNAFVELSEQLASAWPTPIENGDIVEIKTKRTILYGALPMKAVACVTKRFKPYTLNGDTYHHIGVVWHFGYTGYCTGDSANLLTAHIGDANTGIPESKAFICDIRPLSGTWYGDLP